MKLGARLTDSIGSRLVALFLLLALGTVAVFLIGMQRVLQNGWQEYAKPLAADYADQLLAEIGTPPDPRKAAALTERLPVSIRIAGPVVNFDSRHSHARANPMEPEMKEPRTSDWGLVRYTADGHRVTFGLARAPDSERPRWVGGVTLLALLLLTMVAYVTVRRLLSPLQAISAGVAAYGRGDFSTMIPATSKDELGALASRINGMASNLSAMLEAKRSLLLAVSHELRSPLTRARVNAELVGEGEARSALLHDLGEMRDLITDLLESERLATGHSALYPELIDVATLAREVIATHFAGVSLTVTLDENVGPILVDPTRIRLLLRNLIGNAVRQTTDARRAPQVFLRREVGDVIALGVRDYGPGVDADQLDKLGQAFHRTDMARTRAEGGSGLGLYLSKLVAEAHGGTLRIRQSNPGLEVSAVWLAELSASSRLR